MGPGPCRSGQAGPRAAGAGDPQDPSIGSPWERAVLEQTTCRQASRLRRLPRERGAGSGVALALGGVLLAGSQLGQLGRPAAVSSGAPPCIHPPHRASWLAWQGKAGWRWTDGRGSWGEGLGWIVPSRSWIGVRSQASGSLLVTRAEGVHSWKTTWKTRCTPGKLGGQPPGKFWAESQVCPVLAEAVFGGDGGTPPQKATECPGAWVPRTDRPAPPPGL